MTAMSGPEKDSVSRFDDRVTDYVRYRPSYPASAIDHILQGLGPPAGLIAADVGAGTGISARLLGDRGVAVVAVEPGAAMRRAATAHPNVRWVASPAEAMPFAPAIVDLVVAAQAFHWFRAAEALNEFARILRRGGRLAIMWNRPRTSDPLTAGYGQAIVDAGGGVGTARMSLDADVVGRSGAFSAAIRTTFANAQQLDLEGLIGRANSASYVPRSAPASEHLRSLLTELHGHHADRNGLVTIRYETEVFVSRSL